MRKQYILSALAAVCLASCAPQSGERTLYLLTTNDVHGSWFDSTYVRNAQRKSLMAVNWYVDSVRTAVGRDNVLLLDAGDCLQGDNAAYYFNYVDTLSEHLYPRLAAYMGYDAVTVGNHDIETGHRVYDRVAVQLSKRGIPFLAGNALRTSDGKPYFPEYHVFKKAGLKVLVMGYTNANMKAWLDESIWSGMDFKSLVPFVQERVDAVKAKVRPHVTIVSVHSGVGKGDGSMLESQALDLFKTLRGVDFVVASHDHRPFTADADSISIINSGSHARNVGFGKAELVLEKGKVVEKTLSSGLIAVRAEKADPEMRKAFSKEFGEVKAFTLREVGKLDMDMRTRDAYAGMSPYINLVHTVQLLSSEARISFAAPLTYNGTVHAGTLVYNDMFTIYPFENTLYTVNLTGKEIRSYLEYSYDSWIRTWDGKHVLNIVNRDDPRTQQRKWSFVGRSYNFDSAAGLRYTVDVTRPYGERVKIASLADGSSFDENASYLVALTSYRAAGGGNLITAGTGLSAEQVQERLGPKYPEIRELVYRFVSSRQCVTEELVSDPAILGEWYFVPRALAGKAISSDLSLLFR